MSRRHKAIAILQKFQAAVAERLCDLVIENEDDLMQEVHQDFGLTNDIYDLAEKLRVVSVTLSVMPEETSPTAFQQPQSHVVVVQNQPQITLEDFLSLIETEDYNRAAVALTALLGVTLERAQRCLQHFLRQLDLENANTSSGDKGPGVMSELCEIETCKSLNRLVGLLNHVFGLTPQESILAIQRIRQ